MIWFKFENLIFDPCVKDKALNFFWDTLLVLRLQDIHSRYKILIVHQSGVSRINLEGSRAEKDRGGGTGCQSRVNTHVINPKITDFYGPTKSDESTFFWFC